MLTKDQLVASLRYETRIVKHLATKLRPGMLSYRPTPGQRSMLELMQYLTCCIHTPARMIADGNWDASEAIEKAAESVAPENFDRAMDAQLSAVAAIIDAIPHADLLGKQTEMPWGAPCATGEALVNMVLKCITAYRMQFFLYLKAAGRTDLGPANCWIGVDWNPPAEANG